MGRDKALLPFAGRALVEHMLDLLRSLDLDPCICGSRPDLARFAQVIPDETAHRGPLSGLCAALADSDSDLNLFVPVDLPMIPPGFLRWLRARAETSQALATIPRYGGRPQPLCAVYSRRLREGLHNFLVEGNFKVMTAIQGSVASLGEPIDAFDVESVASTSPAGWPQDALLTNWFRNVNTLADYDALRQRLEQMAVIQ
jgi:molybdopterin-guanine dinucleotide biosynthesis protein A